MNANRMLRVAAIGLFTAVALICMGCGTFRDWLYVSEYDNAEPPQHVITIFDIMNDQAIAGDMSPRTNQPIRRAVIAGLTYVDREAYNGWSGACPGCDVDVHRFAAICQQQGIVVAKLLNDQVTRANCVASARYAAKGMSTNDLLILYYSGHGGQLYDWSGDEEDNKDETLCLYDGELDDDTIGKLLNEVPAGVRVWFITDSCNSGTNYRARRSIHRAVSRDFKGALIHYGGCADGESSYGSVTGGVFTETMENTLDNLNRPVSYIEFFTLVKERMPRNQVPAISEYGKVSNSFRLQRVFH